MTSFSALAAPIAYSAPAPRTGLPPGCGSAGPTVVAYRSVGTASGSGSSPVSCSMHTGYGGAESHIRVGPSGDVVQEPADQPYGIRDCAFRDPAGNLIRINELR